MTTPLSRRRTSRIALTGGIATGKTYVRRRLEARGVPTIDADTLAREVVAPGTPGLDAVVERFGRDVLAADGSLNRKLVAQLVFADAAARRDLEAIVHPAVRCAIDVWFDALDPAVHPFAVADIPLLFETRREKDFDATIVTATSPATQLQRLVARDGLSEADAELRIAAQWPIAEKVARATYVIDTDGTPAETDRQVAAVYEQLLAHASGESAG